jgi:hypothetical protein
MPMRRTTAAAVSTHLDPLAPKVARKFLEKQAMAVAIRNVAGHNWGWFSREDERMHVQTVEPDALKGPKKAKAWLENRGRRVFEPEVMGGLGGSDWKKVKVRVDAEREVLESLWIHFMIQNDWIKADLKGSVVTVTAYPGSHNSFTRTLDLRRRFPGAYKYAPTWDERPPKIDFDKEHGLLRIGTENNLDHRDHIDLGEFLFVG